jgi:Zn-dependent protease with chaperone function
LTASLFRRRVIASRELLTGLPADLLAAVVTHEEAHGVRRDGLRGVRRLGQTRPCPAALGALSIGGSSLDARVAALVEEPAALAPRSWRRLSWAFACLLGAALAADTMHHLAESTLGLLTR